MKDECPECGEDMGRHDPISGLTSDAIKQGLRARVGRINHIIDTHRDALLEGTFSYRLGDLLLSEIALSFKYIEAILTEGGEDGR